MENIIILGSQGFIGSAIKNKLIKNINLKIIGANNQKFDLLRLMDLERLKCVVPKNSTLVLTAGIKKQYGDTIENFLLNNKIITSFSEFLNQLQIKTLIYVSSAEVYGNGINISENTQLNPGTLYGSHKIMAELLLKERCKETGINLVILRPPLIYGVGDSSNSYGPVQFFNAAKNGEEIILWGDGDELREFIHIDDFVDVVEILTKEPEKYIGTLNTVSGKSESYLSIVLELRKYFKKIRVINKIRTKDKVDITFNPEKIKAVLKENTSIGNISQGINKMITENK